MGSWTFTADSDLQTDLSTKLNTAADNYDAKVALMYAEIAGMGANWVGEDYDLFKSGTEGYKQALTDLGNSIRMFGKQFEKLSAGTDTLASSCVSIIQSLSSAGGGGFTASTGTGSAGAGTGDGTTGDGAATTSTEGTENGTTGDTTTGDGTNGDTSTTTDGTNGTDTTIVTGTPGDTTTGENGTGEENLNPNGPGNETGEAANAVQAPETYNDDGYTEFFTSSSYWHNIGSDFSENFNYSSADNALDYVTESVGGAVESVIDIGQAGGNVVFDGANDILEGAQWILNGGKTYESSTPVTTEPGVITNPYDNAYWHNLGDDFAENYNFEEANGVLGYAWEGLSGTVETVWDAAMVPVNGVVDTAQGIVEIGEWAWNGILDLFS